MSLKVEIQPQADEALLAALLAAKRNKATLHPVTAICGPLLFQFTADLLALAAEIVARAGDKNIIALISGPFCGFCRTAVTPVSFSEWSTAERLDWNPPEDCPNCGKSIKLEPKLGLRAIKERALRALKQRLTQLDETESP